MGEFHRIVLSSSSLNANLISPKPQSKVRVLLYRNWRTVRVATAARDHASCPLFYN